MSQWSNGVRVFWLTLLGYLCWNRQWMMGTAAPPSKWSRCVREREEKERLCPEHRWRHPVRRNILLHHSLFIIIIIIIWKKKTQKHKFNVKLVLSVCVCALVDEFFHFTFVFSEDISCQSFRLQTMLPVVNKMFYSVGKEVYYAEVGNYF